MLKDQGKAKLQKYVLSSHLKQTTDQQLWILNWSREQFKDLDQRLIAGLRSQQVCYIEAWSYRALYVINKIF